MQLPTYPVPRTLVASPVTIEDTGRTKLQESSGAQTAAPSCTLAPYFLRKAIDMKHGTCKNCGGRIYRMEQPTYIDWKHYSNFNVRCPGSPVAEPIDE